ncbi:hypothetical protein BRD00_07005 [Halobacteriales archaeon QS_8_69_26]|nr:MAG: hypothetical protein BRD00_07005 [Halobacteriales archaeon QS_8_69_26]
MTQWIEDPSGGRDRGPAALVRAWAEVMVRPSRFFENAVAPGDQAPGLVFAMLVVLVEETVRVVALGDYPVVADQPTISAVLWIGVMVLLITPAMLHLAAAIATVVLVPMTPDRAGVSETVQVLGYASAPCLFAAVPVLQVRAAAVVYGAVLAYVGIGRIHRIPPLRTVLATAAPAYVVFGYGFRGIESVGRLLAKWYII